LRRTSFERAKMQGSYLAFAKFDETNFSRADLTRAVLGAADEFTEEARKLTFMGATMVNADLRRLRAPSTNFALASLRWAKLSYARLRNSDFTGADLTCTDLRNTD